MGCKSFKMAFNKKKWRPNAGQKRAFIQRMQDPAEEAAYTARKSASRLYDNWKEKDFVPTMEQYNYCMENITMATGEQLNALNQVIYGFTCQEKVNHAYIHVVNQLRRGEISFENHQLKSNNGTT